MSQMPAIVISAKDHDRIYALIDRLGQKSETVLGLQDELDRANIVEPDELPAKVVRMNSKVRFKNEDSSREFTAELVYPNEVNGSSEKISILSPAGAALLGLKVGDRIEWPLGGRTLHITLMDVE